ncbi:MAG: hypothetical protein ACHBN1_27955 [Heteroscytonema crispum UTEX LB 1556]
MNKQILPPDDFPSNEPTPMDWLLRRELEHWTCKRFYEACDRITRALLSSCEWHITTNASLLTLIIACPDVETYWYIVSNMSQLGNRLKRFANKAKIRVFPPPGNGTPFEMRVDEISAY